MKVSKYIYINEEWRMKNEEWRMKGKGGGIRVVEWREEEKNKKKQKKKSSKLI